MSLCLIAYAILGHLSIASASSTNLISNPSFEMSTDGSPTNWEQGNWGTNSSTFSYVKSNGHTGSNSVTVAISSITDGDAKWYADPVAVTPGANYTYSDFYKSNVTTRVVYALIDANNSVTYVDMPDAAQNATWTHYSAQLTTLNSTKSVTVYHLLDKVGALNIDDVSLTQDTTETIPPAPIDPDNLVTNPSLETTASGGPDGWLQNGWGSHTTTPTYVTNDGHDGSNSAKVTISDYQDGDEKWYFKPINSVKPEMPYMFSSWYKTNTQPHVVIAYTDSNGTDSYMSMADPTAPSVAATEWQHYTSSFTLPTGATNMSVYMLLSSNGWLQVDDYSVKSYVPVTFSNPIISLTFDDGWKSVYKNALPKLKKYNMQSTQYIVSGFIDTPRYMTQSMISAFQAQGSEIAGHTITHPDLTTLTPQELTYELSQSQSSLRSLFGASVAENLASPYGAYNATTIDAIRPYYRSQRSTDAGYNTRENFNIYNIVVQNIIVTTTPAEVASWVEHAKADNSWLVIVYHQVDRSGSEYSVTPAHLNRELANIKASGVEVKTVSGALDEIAPQLQ